MTSAPAAQPRERTFQLDDSLPPLPVPLLEQTLQRYLESTRPFSTAEEYEATKRIVDEFGQGVGKELHSRLEAKARTCKNWVEDWWEDLAYLSGRAPLAIQCNLYGLGPFQCDIWPPEEGSQCDRVAIVAWHTLDYFQAVRREKIPVDKSRSGMVFSMNQLRSLFGCVRIPGESRDRLVRHFKTEREGPCPNHVVVFSNGHIFLMRPFDHKERLMPAKDINRQLCMIKKMSTCRGQGVAVLTADDRTSYAKAYKHLAALDPINRSHLDTIEQAVFTIILDDAKPKTITEHMAMTIKFDAHNCWADKSYGLIGSSNGIISCMGDHSPFDGMVIVSLNGTIHERLLQTAGRFPVAQFQGFSNYQPPKELIFTVDETIVRAMDKAFAMHTANAANLEIFSSRCGAFGKLWTKRHKLHPDTVFQLAMQHAYYSLHHKPVATYETATTRQFYHGRTETLRTCTVESVRWCQAMLDPSISLSERRGLFLAALKKHNENMAEACNAQGCDRHLLGLQALAIELGMPTPDLYKDPAYSKSGGGGNFMLSTSCSGYTDSLGAVAPMCNDGYATFYSIRDNYYYPCFLTFKSSKETNIKQFFVAVNASLAEIHDLIMMGNSKM